MSYDALKIGDLCAKIPIIQGGMGIGISLGKLAGAVAGEGGVGVISAAQIGFREPDFYEDALKANLRAIKKELAKARKIAPRGVIGFNIMVACNHYKELVIEAAKAGADLIISGAGVPTELPEYVKGFKTKIAPIVSSEKSAKVLLKLWDKRYGTTADMVVIEGPLAGGHLGFKPGEIAGKINNFDDDVKGIITIVKEYAEKYKKKIPVILAGGISEKKDVEKAFSLGVQGVQVATRFVTTEECDASNEYKESYISAREEDVIIVKSPVGMPGRAINNLFMQKVNVGEKFTPKKCFACMRHCNPTEIPYCITERLINAAKGDIDNALLFCGGKVGKENKIRTVKEVIKELMG
jgi:NAD(P)H-dependent flavin oxidoreductase YrpB (nitropropane dioxygenase family)